MTTTEELLVDYLNEQARAATVEFTLEDVEQGTLPVSLVDQPRRPDRRTGLIGVAVAAGITLIVGTVILRAATDSPSPVETETSTETSTETEPAVEPDNAPDTGAELPGTPVEPAPTLPAPSVSIELSTFQLDDTVDSLHVSSVAHNAGRSVAVGWVMDSDRSRPAIWWSDDGATWTRVEQDDELFGPTNSAPFAPVELFDVIATPDGFIAVGGNEEFFEQDQPMVWRSDDGIAWARIPPDPDINRAYMRAITPFEGGFVAAGLAPWDDGALDVTWRSDDGLDWDGAVRAPDQLFDLASVPTASGSLLFGVADGIVYYSSDSIGWLQAVATRSPEIETLPGIGVIVEDADGLPIASSDGATWAPLALAHAADERIDIGAATGSTELMLIYGTTYLPVADASTCDSRTVTGTWLWASADGGESWQQLQLEPATSSGHGTLLDIGDQILSVGSAPSLIDKAQIVTALAELSTAAGPDAETAATAGQESTAAASSSCP